MAAFERTGLPGRPSNSTMILVADDDVTNLFVLKAMLSKLGFSVVTAIDGLEAVSAAISVSSALVLIDLSMPRMNGLEAAARIQSEFSRSSPPIIAVTANVTENQRKVCKAAGFQDFIGKPISFTELASVVGRFMPGSEVNLSI